MLIKSLKRIWIITGLLFFIISLAIYQLPIIKTDIYNAPRFKGEPVEVLIWLKIPINYDKIMNIKERTYQAIAKAGSLTEVDELLDSMRKLIRREIEHTAKPYIEQIKKEFTRIGIKVLDEIYLLPILHVLVPKDAISWLKKQPYVLSVFENFKVRAQLDVAAKAIKADTWWENGYNGSNYFNDNIQGIEVAVLDTGIQMDHPFLKNRIIDAKDFSSDHNITDLNGHGTHVAGIIASTHNIYRGIAFGANLLNAKCLDKNGHGEDVQVISALDWAVTQASDTAEIINMSFGSTNAPPDGESSLTRYIDAIAELYDVAIVVAAGNTDTGPKINLPGDGYNVITVGAIDDRDTVDRSDDIIAAFSCEGPTDDGRIKPDLVAPGVNIVSSYIRSTIYPLSGTSMATPMVSGALALIAPILIPEFGENWVIAAKALLINSADDWYIRGPDGKSGWGYINLLNAWNQREYIHVDEVTEENPSVFSIYTEGGESVKVTIVWERHFREILGSYKPYEVSKLRVQLFDPDGNFLMETSGSPDNVKQIVFIANKSGYYLVRVVADYIDPSLGSEIFAITSSNEIIMGNVTVGLRLEASISKKVVQDSEILPVITEIKCIANNTIHNVKLNITCNLFECLNETPIEIGDIKPNETIRIIIALKPLNLGVGSFKIFAYYMNDSLAIKTGSVTISGISIVDDDSSPPNITILSIEKTGGILPRLRIKARIKDPSGVFCAFVLFGINREINESDYDGKIAMRKTDEPDIYEAEMMINPTWMGSKVFIRILAIDNDSDRPEDTMIGLSEIQKVEIGFADFRLFLGISAVILVTVIIMIKVATRKKGKESEYYYF